MSHLRLVKRREWDTETNEANVFTNVKYHIKDNWHGYVIVPFVFVLILGLGFCGVKKEMQTPWMEVIMTIAAYQCVFVVGGVMALLCWQPCKFIRARWRKAIFQQKYQTRQPRIFSRPAKLSGDAAWDKEKNE